MTGIELFVVAFAAAFVAVAVLSLAAVVRRDGFGARPAPRSRPDWADGRRPSSPYRFS